MRSAHILLSAIHFFACFFLLVIGIGCVFSPLLPEARHTVIRFLETQNNTIWVGLIFIGFASLLFVGLFYLYRTQFYQVLLSSKKLQITVEKPLLRQFVESYWHTRFPSEIAVQDLWFRPDGKWEFQIQFHLQDLERQKEILETSERELGVLLQKQFGYQSDFVLNVTVS